MAMVETLSSQETFHRLHQARAHSRTHNMDCRRSLWYQKEPGMSNKVALLRVFARVKRSWELNQGSAKMAVSLPFDLRWFKIHCLLTQ